MYDSRATEARSEELPRSVWAYFVRALAEKCRRMPASFYIALATPAVLLMGAQLGALREDPRQFVFVLALLFIFFGVASLRGVLDLLDISRRELLEHSRSYRDTLGEAAFAEELGKRVREREGA